MSMAEVELKTMDETPQTQLPGEADPVTPETSSGSSGGSESGVDGVENQAYSQNEEPEVPFGPPPITYVDFLPLLLETAASSADAPRYAEFSTVLEQANQWLKGNQDFMAMKCESFIKRLEGQDVLKVEAVIDQESSFGINKYVRCLRLWLSPREDPNIPVQEISHVTMVPDATDGSEGTAEQLMALFTPSKFKTNASSPSYCGIVETMDKLNKFLKKKPIPGSVMNVEIVKIKYEEASDKCVDSEKTCWVDCGKMDRIYVHSIRVFYLIGKPTFEVVCYHDEVPVCLNNWDTMTKMRFCPYTTLLQRANKWLKTQRGIKVINMQTVDVIAERAKEGQAKVHSEMCGLVEAANQDMQLARVLRIFYVREPKSDGITYESINLTSRLFVPARRGDWGKDTESFSKTMQRVIRWLQLTNVPIFGIETVRHPFTPESYGLGVKEDCTSMSLIAHSGKHYINTVRCYFPCEYEEPSPDLLPKIEEEEGWWACSIS